MANMHTDQISLIASKGDIGGFQEAVIRQIYKTWMLKSGNVAIDIGAHSGLHTLPMAECVGESGLIFSFEACCSLASALQLQLEKAGIGQVKLTHAAVGLNNGGVVKFYKNLDHPGQSTIVKGYGHNFIDDYSYDVPLINLDSLVTVIGQRVLRFIKIDAEGAELEILKGGIELLKAHSPLVAAEITNRLFRKYKIEFYKLLEEISYSAFTLLGDELNDQVIDSERGSPLYTLLFAKRGHWVHDFCSNPTKLRKFTLYHAEKWSSRYK